LIICYDPGEDKVLGEVAFVNSCSPSVVRLFEIDAGSEASCCALQPVGERLVAAVVAIYFNRLKVMSLLF
jgi:hypothetical protein